MYAVCVKSETPKLTLFNIIIIALKLKSVNNLAQIIQNQKLQLMKGDYYEFYNN